MSSLHVKTITLLIIIKYSQTFKLKDTDSFLVPSAAKAVKKTTLVILVGLFHSSTPPPRLLLPSLPFICWCWCWCRCCPCCHIQVAAVALFCHIPPKLLLTFWLVAGTMICQLLRSCCCQRRLHSSLLTGCWRHSSNAGQGRRLPVIWMKLLDKSKFKLVVISIQIPLFFFCCKSQQSNLLNSQFYFLGGVMFKVW